MVKQLLIFSFFFVSVIIPGICKVKMPKIFNNHMVLQRNRPITLWGWGTPSDLISIQFGTEINLVKVDENGEWILDLPPMSAGGPFILNVKGPKNQLIFENILIGDLWICAGQSNMEWTNYQFDYHETDTNFLNADIRLFKAFIDTDYLPKDDLKGGIWQLLDEESMRNFSALSYYFGKKLIRELGVPIGLINISLGSSSIEAWMSNDVLLKFPQFKEEVSSIVAHNKSSDELRIDFEKIKEGWEKKYYLNGTLALTKVALP